MLDGEAFSAKEYSGDNDYIRLPRYNSNKIGLKGTDIPKDYFRTGLFKPHITYHIQVVKYQYTIEMHIQNLRNNSEILTCKWDVSILSTCEKGRIVS